VNIYIVVTASGEDRPGLINELARVVADCKCNISDSRMTRLGQSFGMIMLVQGSWNSLAKLELQLQRLEQSLGLMIHVRRTDGPQNREDMLPYAIEVIAPDQPGIIHRLADFFAKRSINVEDLAMRSYPAVHTGTTMCSVNMVVGVPAKLHIAVLREEFMDYCDQFNWDAVLEPVKS
jgi:glycine cleavage system transcriptional repressor